MKKLLTNKKVWAVVTGVVMGAVVTTIVVAKRSTIAAAIEDTTEE